MTYVNGILTHILRDGFTSGPVIGHVFTEQQMSADLTDWVVAAQLAGGGSRVDPRFSATRALVQIDGFARGSSTRAQGNCQAAIDYIVAAWLNQTVTPAGRIARVNDVNGPEPLDVTSAPDVYRYVGTLQITVR